MIAAGEARALGDITRLVRNGKFVGWYIRYKDVDGTRRQRASHQPTKELARRYLLAVEGRVARGQLGIPEPAPAAPTVAKLCERFLVEYARPRIKDPSKYRKWAAVALGRALPLIGAMPSDGLQPLDLVRLRETLGRQFAASSVRATLDFLGTVFSWAVKAQIVAANPLKGIEKPRAATSLEYLSRAEVQALLALTERQATGGTLSAQVRYVAIFLVLHTGLRKGELFGLRWADVDLDARRLTVARSFRAAPKSGVVRHLRLPATVVPVLAAWRPRCPRIAADSVVPVLDGKPRMGGPADLLGLPEALREVGCRALLHPWHALRHTFASHLVMSGGNILALQRILGHADIKQTLVYAHLGDDYLASEIDRLKF